MKGSEFKAARDALGMTHDQLAHALGLSLRTSYRGAIGDLAEPAARLLRLLVVLRLTVSDQKFNQLLKEIEK